MCFVNLSVSSSSCRVKLATETFCQNTRKYPIVCSSINITFTLSCGVSYVPRLAKVVNVLAIWQVKQGTETTGFRIGFTLHSCQYVSS